MLVFIIVGVALLAQLGYLALCLNSRAANRTAAGIDAKLPKKSERPISGTEVIRVATREINDTV